MDDFSSCDCASKTRFFKLQCDLFLIVTKWFVWLNLNTLKPQHWWNVKLQHICFITYTCNIFVFVRNIQYQHYFWWLGQVELQLQINAHTLRVNKHTHVSEEGTIDKWINDSIDSDLCTVNGAESTHIYLLMCFIVCATLYLLQCIIWQLLILVTLQIIFSI